MHWNCEQVVFWQEGGAVYKETVIIGHKWKRFQKSFLIAVDPRVWYVASNFCKSNTFPEILL